MQKAILHGKPEQVATCFYLEHRARLSILKAAIGTACLVDIGALPDKVPATLPSTFRDGMKTLRTHKAFKQYALFWQVLLWGFGGFVLTTYKAEEYAWLAEQTGVPVEEVPNALKAFDILFPMGTSWLTQLGGSDCQIVKMVPSHFRGIGAYQRLRRLAKENYPELDCDAFGAQLLINWHNCMVEFLAVA